MLVAAQWVVKDDLLAESKLNSYEKTKKAKPGLAVMDTLEELAAQAKAKGGAQYLDEEDINIRLKWLGLFHRLKYVPGTFMQRFKCPNGSFTLKQWRVRLFLSLALSLSLSLSRARSLSPISSLSSLSALQECNKHRSSPAAALVCVRAHRRSTTKYASMMTAPGTSGRYTFLKVVSWCSCI
jgi:hypothetical protein